MDDIVKSEVLLQNGSSYEPSIEPLNLYHSHEIPECCLPPEEAVAAKDEASGKSENPSIDSMLEFKGNPRRNRLDDKKEQSTNDYFALSTALPPWEYLLDHCNKSRLNDKEQFLDSSSAIYLERCTYLLNSIDNVLERLKNLVNETCSIRPSTTSSHLPNCNYSKNTVVDNGVLLSNNISMLLGSAETLYILQPEKLESEFLRCSSVVDSVVELFHLMENDGYADIDLNGINPVENIKEERTVFKVEGDSVKAKVKKKTKRSAKQAVKQKIKTQQEEIDLQEHSYDSDDIHEKSCYDGFSTEFCITKDEYLYILNKGKPYTCPPCQRQFNGRRSFRRHLLNKCVGESIEHLKAKWKKEHGMYTCLAPGCGKAWKRKETLYSHHQKEHLHGITCPFKCDKCEKTFYMRGLLNNHIKEDHMTTFCELCGKGVKGKLKLHMMRHTGDKPHKCKYCDYSAISSGQVKNHTTLMHETHKLPLHFCDICGKDFKLKGHLKEHILTHSDKRTYLCKICGKYLKNPNSYRRHMVSVHKVSHR